ncbi:sugar ABC transporter ATP-binding protein [Aquirufa aurantiipilula]|uniref:Sugar ABC transporter ATP-binding protein n=1 Tax=Aquirufa aurantiipilula TaxID=2696561 RepID=A0ABT6BNL7_9BACT|nr:sugar ABC transporter ATP-binding protein [Aquirufa aurantiipilula]MDF5691649.1 sugar ABC transporter ATP-binding protein [Aquirufa aurantiipilula]
MEGEKPVLELNQVSIAYSGTPILHSIDLSLYPGEIHALVGENGAGKSTLMKTILGIISPDKGEVIFFGQKRHHQSLKQIMESGISMIHQELMLIPELSIAENIFLGRENELGFWPWERKKNAQLKTAELLRDCDIPLDPATLVKNLSIAEQQLVEILRAISQRAHLILMDEPTSSLSEKEITLFRRLIHKLKNEGVSILFTSHKMEEIFGFSDRISVLRDGYLISSSNKENCTEQEIVQQMVGREMNQFFPHREVQSGDISLQVKGLGIPGLFQGIEFDLHQGEILGFGGLVGAGRTDIGKALAGLLIPQEGEIKWKNQLVKFKNPQEAILQGIGYVSEDRKEMGFIPEFSVQHNLTLSSLLDFQRWGILDKSKEKETAEGHVSRMKIKTQGVDQQVMYLSGGNQQKVVFGRVLQHLPEVLILDEPTRGIDVQAKFEIYTLMAELSKQGKSIILISSDLPELMHMSDRILVISKGKQTATLKKEETNPAEIMSYAMK